MMIGSMLAKVLTDRWCKLQVFFWTNIVLAVFSCAFYFFNPHATTLIMVLYFLLNILHQIPSPLHWSLMSDVDDYGELETGGVFINGYSASDPRVAFGGVKKSGFGRELSHFGVREFCNVQTVWLDRN